MTPLTLTTDPAPTQPRDRGTCAFLLQTDSGVFSFPMDTTLILYGHGPLLWSPLGGDSSYYTYSEIQFDSPLTPGNRLADNQLTRRSS